MKLRDMIKEAYYRIMPQKVTISHVYKKVLGKPMNWENPVDLNEKINWLKVYGDTSKWTEYADKFLVRNYIEKCGLSEILVPLYGVYNDACDIDFDSLPNSFVIKANHGSGDCIIVKDKRDLDVVKTRAELNNFLRYRYGLYQGEPHYMGIKPKIVIEKLLDNDELSFTKTLVDYKVWCFDGKPYSIWACYNRSKTETYVDVYDMDWHCHPEHSVYNNFYKAGKGIVPKPINFEKMLNAAAILSKGFPELRVDFYEVKGELYFGELTFTSHGGYMDFYSQEYLIELGNQCMLSPKNI